jgi:hypothetical protein
MKGEGLGFNNTPEIYQAMISKSPAPMFQEKTFSFTVAFPENVGRSL